MTTIRLVDSHNGGKLVCENGTIATVRLFDGFNTKSDLFDDEPYSRFGPCISVPVSNVEVEATDETGTRWLPLPEAIKLGLVEE